MDVLARSRVVRGRCHRPAHVARPLFPQGRPPRSPVEALAGRAGGDAAEAVGMILPEQVDAVVVPLDGSPLSLRALPVGVALAQRFGADIHLFSAVSTVD